MAAEQRRYTSITHYFSDPEAAKVWDVRLDRLLVSYFGGTKSRYQMLDWLLRFAIRFHWIRFTQGLGPDADTVVEVDGLPPLVVIADELKVYEERQALVDKLSVLYEMAGMDLFVEFCETHEIDWEAFLSGEFSFESATSESWATRADRQLAIYLADGDNHSVEEIRQRAEEDGLITGGDDVDWKKLKVVATRRGYSSAAPYGFWAIPKRSRHR